MKAFLTLTILLQLLSPAESYSAVPRRSGGHRSRGDTLDARSPRSFSKTLTWKTKAESSGEACTLKALETAGASPSARAKVKNLRETSQFVDLVYEKRREAARLCAAGETGKCESPDEPIWETLGLQKPAPCPTIQSFKLSECEGSESTELAESSDTDAKEAPRKRAANRKKRARRDTASASEASRTGATKHLAGAGEAGSEVSAHQAESTAQVRPHQPRFGGSTKLHKAEEQVGATQTEASAAENNDEARTRSEGEAPELGAKASGPSGEGEETPTAMGNTENTGEGNTSSDSAASGEGKADADGEGAFDSEEHAFAEVEAQNVFDMIKDMFGNGMEISDPQNFEGGNQGSYFDFMYPQSTDYPWACVCDENQYKRWEAKEIQAVPCRNQVDMSIQGIVAACNPKNHKMNVAERTGDRLYISVWLPATACLAIWMWN
ncbi:hypothetical protein NCLIV_060870 [Neospora caninum Liverpool]|uniref:SRS domain-containing protein n=1 Tax=Neospora caninum (strain Liverpool) TaxID=572307 RepID=F0VPL6_NEOCL|nr:hypothetical protein NCLIV_060870 [Neospora caninum Liverpool]CBZ55663.1 hypothetical protein NCLIV_060870 [Neospora caninum Liverpool]CEL70405.1 TPA: hypothetical protein BN1204_060870 [Neospora caninum Liverpool]|eukprot:XP_003885689.1 hypothetical protein NCLIV_060870 [Neospora caninum Liverpool]